MNDEAKENFPTLVVLGGDGSYMSVVKRISDAGVKMDWLKACFLPFGSGNDMPRQMGWGGDLKPEFFRSLESLVTEVLTKSKVSLLDVWEVEVSSQSDDGGVFKVDGHT